jgi:hypothetical protein
MRPVIAGSEFSIGIKVPRQQLIDAIDGVIGDPGQHHSWRDRRHRHLGQVASRLLDHGRSALLFLSSYRSHLLTRLRRPTQRINSSYGREQPLAERALLRCCRSPSDHHRSSASAPPIVRAHSYMHVKGGRQVFIPLSVPKSCSISLCGG